MPDPTRESISATETPALFNASPYLTKRMLYERIANGVDIDSPENNRMDWGKRMQGVLLQAAAEDHKLDVLPNIGSDGKEVYIRRGRIGCTRDAVIIDPQRGPGALEIKMCNDYRVWRESWGSGATPPRHNEVQLQQQIMVGDGVTPFTWGLLGCWIAGEMKYWKREPMPRLWAQIEKETTQFYEDVAAKKAPDWIGDPVEMPLLTELFPPRFAKVTDFTTRDDAEKLAEKCLMLNYHSKERLGHAKAEDKLKAELRALLLDAEEGRFIHGIKFTVKQSDRKGYMVPAGKTTRTDLYVPDDVPRGNIAKDFTADLGG